MPKKKTKSNEKLKIQSIFELKEGDKVFHIPFNEDNEFLYKNGIVKTILTHKNDVNDHVFVVYNCGGNWENYRDYTGTRTHIKELRKGWHESK